MKARSYLYIAPSRTGFYIFTDDRLAGFTERHKIKLEFPSLQTTTDPQKELERYKSIDGVVMGLEQGWLGRWNLLLAKKVLKAHRRVFVYWPKEEAVECIDAERIQSHWRHWIVIKGYQSAYRFYQKVYRILRTTRSRLRRLLHKQAPEIAVKVQPNMAESYRTRLQEVIQQATPVPLSLPYQPDPSNRLKGYGVYLRTDFWAKISSGGSYGHTCYVAKALASMTENLVCFMPHRYSLLDDLGLHQVVLDPPSPYQSEEDILSATRYYYLSLKVAFQALRPAYLYERLCLGNYVGTLLSQELGIPYIVEYNGSEISMMRSFAGRRYDYEEVYLKAEEVAFRQATMISVVSEIIKDDLVKRGVSPDKILVNPNGADLDAYAPLPPDKKRALRQELGWNDTHRIISFTGTFGGWHGVDVLAAAIPQICQDLPEARFLIIGDGNYKHRVDEQIARYKLSDRVHCTGRIPQKEGARWLGACDVYVSPHNSHMVDSRFFGSPTKIFEYMALGGGIVASNLEQIGQVLSPALKPGDLENPSLTITDQRAVLCVPGDVNEFINAVIQLAKRPELCQALGRNARQAVANHYSWDRHVARLWRFLRGEMGSESPIPDQPKTADTSTSLKRIDTGDTYKDEVQNQWNQDPAGSHYVKKAQRHTLEWFLEAEAYRYGEYAPWMPETMEFTKHGGRQLLEIGSGMGTDLCQFAKHGTYVTDLDLSAGHLELAQENFKLRGLSGRFTHHDAEDLPFDDNSFDIVYSNGVLHHTPNTTQVVREIYRVLKPGGRVIVMVYAENSLHYWRILVGGLGLVRGLLQDYSMGEIMSRHTEISENNARPLVKVYTKKKLGNMFKDFVNIEIVQRQLIAPELPWGLRWIPIDMAGKLMGWNLIIKATRPE
jgi:glycosyltransferase involved in cell wall biosynthesis/ubiquinone/menaquinone biosynthesis C-methylase UbiE